jgi:hypothetical protein
MGPLKAVAYVHLPVRMDPYFQRMLTINNVLLCCIVR